MHTRPLPRALPPSALLQALDDRTIAAADCFAAGLIDFPPGQVHPIARKMLGDGGPLSLNELIHEMHVLAYGEPPRDPRNAITAMLSTSHFPDVVLSTARGIAAARLGGSELFELLSRVCLDVETATFAAESVALVDVDEQPMPGPDDADTFWPIQPRIVGAPVRVHTRPAKLVVTEQILLNDDAGFLRAAVGAYVDSAHRAEHRHLTRLLETNAPLATDSQPLFGAATGNDCAAVAPTRLVDTLARLLRTQETESGQPAGAPLKTILVPAGLEGHVLGLVTANLPPGNQPRVMVLAHAESQTTIYGISDPAYFPNLVRARLRGSAPDAVSFPNLGPAAWTDRRGRTHHIPGLAIEAVHSVGIWPVNRVGIVRARIDLEVPEE